MNFAKKTFESKDIFLNGKNFPFEKIFLFDFFKYYYNGFNMNKCEQIYR